MSSLYPHQVTAIAEVKSRLAANPRSRLLIQMPTGSGKTRVFVELIKELELRGEKSVLVISGQNLIFQAHKRLLEFGVNAAIVMGSYTQPGEGLCEIISIDTARARRHYPPAKYVFIDEAHLGASESYLNFVNHYRDAAILSFTATPYLKGGLRGIADELIYPTSVSKLTLSGILAPIKYFSFGSPDLSNVKQVGGDYNEKEVYEATATSKIYGSVVEQWEKHCRGGATLCFAINIEHARQLVANYLEAGIRAEVILGDTDPVLRQRFVEGLEQGRLDVIVSVGTMIAGVDIPCLTAIQCVRPTKSKILFIQMLGRGSRCFPGKQYCKYLDHAGNLMEHGLLAHAGKGWIEPLPKKSKQEGEQVVASCPECHCVFERNISICPECGWEKEKTGRRSFLETIAGDLVEVDDFELLVAHKAAEAIKYNHKVTSLWFKIGEALELSADELYSFMKTEPSRMRVYARYKKKIEQYRASESGAPPSGATKPVLPGVEERDGGGSKWGQVYPLR